MIHHDHSADRPYSHRSKLFWRRAYLEEHLLKKGACLIKIDQFSYSSIGNVRYDSARYVLNHRRRNVKIVDFYRYGYCMIVAYIIVQYGSTLVFGLPSSTSRTIMDPIYCKDLDFGGQTQELQNSF